jgi:hypothetical protein
MRLVVQNWVLTTTKNQQHLRAHSNQSNTNQTNQADDNSYKRSTNDLIIEQHLHQEQQLYQKSSSSASSNESIKNAVTSELNKKSDANVSRWETRRRPSDWSLIQVIIFFSLSKL